ncbi:MAG: hypothetical protein P8144_13430 [Gammaproteobacteria bacterium]
MPRKYVVVHLYRLVCFINQLPSSVFHINGVVDALPYTLCDDEKSSN